MVDKIAQWIVDGTLLKAVGAAWLLFIGGTIVVAYHAYLPPDFTVGFLAGRQGYFYGLYALGFYAHIATAPPVLVIGILQSSRTLRRRATRWHERCGQAYCLMILWAMAPGGLIMAFWAYSGWPATAAFVTLSLLTWWFTYRGWKSIGQWDVAAHGRWMQRSFILVCSAIFLRVLSAEAGSWGWDRDTAYAAISWLCWLPPWLLYEAILLLARRRSSPTVIGLEKVSFREKHSHADRSLF